jgi:hypothetical protein
MSSHLLNSLIIKESSTESKVQTDAKYSVSPNKLEVSVSSPEVESGKDG